jgi:hypothetical protein
MPDDDENRLRYAKLVAKVWADDSLRQRLISDPATVLREFGLTVPEGKEIKIIEADYENSLYLILPSKPTDLPPDFDLDLLVTLDEISTARCAICI